MNIPGELKKGNRTYIYQERINNRVVLYKEKIYGWKECFLLQDLIKVKTAKPNSPFHKDKEGKKKYEI